MIRIENESGKPLLTRVIDVETGDDLTKTLRIVSIRFKIDRAKFSATIELDSPRISVVPAGAMFVMRHPFSGEELPVRFIEFIDGLRLSFKEDGSPVIEPAKRMLIPTELEKKTR